MPRDGCRAPAAGPPDGPLNQDDGPGRVGLGWVGLGRVGQGRGAVESTAKEKKRNIANEFCSGILATDI